MIPVPQLGWMAGVVDLKGRLIYKRNQQRATTQVVLMVESKEFAVIKELSRLTGTRPEYKKEQPLKEFMRRGCAEHCPESHVHVNDYGADRTMPAISRWTVTGAAMVVVLSNLMPYLQIDRGYSGAIEMVRQSTALEGQGSGAVFASLDRLHSLGWELPKDYLKALQAHWGEKEEGERADAGS